MTTKSSPPGKRLEDMFFGQDNANQKLWLCRCVVVKMACCGFEVYKFFKWRERTSSQKYSQTVQKDIIFLKSSSHSYNYLKFLWKEDRFKIHAWLEYVIHNMRPSSLSREPDVGKYLKYDSMFYQTIQKFTNKLVKYIKWKCPNIALIYLHLSWMVELTNRLTTLAYMQLLLVISTMDLSAFYLHWALY